MDSLISLLSFRHILHSSKMGCLIKMGLWLSVAAGHRFQNGHLLCVTYLRNGYSYGNGTRVSGSDGKMTFETIGTPRKVFWFSHQMSHIILDAGRRIGMGFGLLLMVGKQLSKLSGYHWLYFVFLIGPLTSQKWIAVSRKYGIAYSYNVPYFRNASSQRDETGCWSSWSSDFQSDPVSTDRLLYFVCDVLYFTNGLSCWEE